MTEFVREFHPALNKWLYQFTECIVDGKPVSKKVLELILALTGFDSGAVFLGDTENDFKLKLRHGGFKDIKSMRILCRGFLDIRPNEIQIVADLRKCRWAVPLLKNPVRVTIRPLPTIAAPPTPDPDHAMYLRTDKGESKWPRTLW